MKRVILFISLMFYAFCVQAADEYFRGNGELVVINPTTAVMDTPERLTYCVLNSRTVDVDDSKSEFEATVFTCEEGTVILLKRFLNDEYQRVLMISTTDAAVTKMTTSIENYEFAGKMWVATSSKIVEKELQNGGS